MDKISAIRCTVNTESVTEADILDAADALWEESEGQGYDRESLAEALSLPADHPAITERVLLAVSYSWLDWGKW